MRHRSAAASTGAFLRNNKLGCLLSINNKLEFSNGRSLNFSPDAGVGMSTEPRQILEAYDSTTDQRSFSLDEASSAEESHEVTRLSLETEDDRVPYIGQRFVSHDAAYDCYSEFAKGCGFSIRRHRTEGKDGVGKGITRRYFVCHRAGNTPLKVLVDSKPQRNRKSSRCGCQAYMRISKVVDLDTPEWRVTGFANHHNHELLEPGEVRFLPAYRTISESDKNRILMFAKTGISIQQMMKLMELEKCLEPGFLPFTEKDVRNLLQSFKKVEQDDENVDLLRMCKTIKERDPNFKYEYTVNIDNKLEKIAWSYASSIQLYEAFGDAIVFDTTHRLTAFDMPMGIWLGMNNYGVPCFFGCVLLKEQNIQSFSWALKAFVGFMNGRAPQTILTDQNIHLKEAIALGLPTTKHAFCIWLIMAKFPSWFNAVLGERYNEWKAEFFRLYSLEAINEFEIGWREMVTSFGLQSNRHMSTLYTFRNLWALPYMRSHFFGGLTLPGISKSINGLIQRFLSTQTRATQFIEQAAIAVDFKDPAAEHQTMQQNLQTTCLKVGAPIESHAATILTPYAFSKLQDELVLAAHYASFQTDDGSYAVRHHTRTDGGEKVIWVPQEEILSCSCRMFEFCGILCRHALRVLSTANCFQIPSCYFPARWRRANSMSSKGSQGAVTHFDHPDQLQALQSMVSALVSEAAKSKERLSMASEEIASLLARIREHPISTQLKRDHPKT